MRFLRSIFLAFVSCVWSRVIYDAPRLHTQGRLLPPMAPEKEARRPTLQFHSSVGMVGLHVTASNSHDEKYVELPLRQRVVPGSNSSLPVHVQSARIADPSDPRSHTTRIQSAVSYSFTSRHQRQRLRDIERIACTIRAVLSEEEKGMLAHQGTGEVDCTVAFTFQDGTVSFEQPGNRWFLAGREVESMECT
ncbi:uncharacterized protein BDZ99DRAFT_186225 [Mytilinidion resinicola]|uniref:Uncharacterized protein n=1 Tax=Mytilinidion resinicola TaxID=574789 RepID=A0A6A6Z3Y6_9PEZI|nr:uncharacterized protein BDZ99DRAFT_186225 [Mytilinidion resinicola]KAF2814875.1 hypothetical protein BDZ99DRAFT_186225 [Mytilinidion resinicola]